MSVDNYASQSSIPSQFRAIQELVDSEKRYLDQLNLIENFFSRPLSTSSLEYGDHSVLFSQLPAIYQVNQHLLNALVNTTSTLSSEGDVNYSNIYQSVNRRLGNIFIKVAPFLKFYSSYAQSFGSAIKVLETLSTSNPTVFDFIKSQETRPEVQMSLNALLITPIQRIARYRLLLSDILKKSPTDCQSRTLERAISEIECVAKHVNEQLRQHEHNTIIFHIQNCLTKDDTIIRPGRHLIRHGSLMKLNKTSVSDSFMLRQSSLASTNVRYVVLFSDALMICKILHNSTFNKSHIDEIWTRKFNFMTSTKNAVKKQEFQKIEFPCIDKGIQLEMCSILPLENLTVTKVMSDSLFKVSSCLANKSSNDTPKIERVTADEYIWYSSSCSGEHQSRNDELPWVESIQMAIEKHNSNLASLKIQSVQFHGEDDMDLQTLTKCDTFTDQLKRILKETSSPMKLKKPLSELSTLLVNSISPSPKKKMCQSHAENPEKCLSREVTLVSFVSKTRSLNSSKRVESSPKTSLVKSSSCRLKTNLSESAKSIRKRFQPAMQDVIDDEIHHTSPKVFQSPSIYSDSKKAKR